MVNLYDVIMGKAPAEIPHWEHWSCPDAESYITGIDYYRHPRRCRLKLLELYPLLDLPIPENDDSIPRPSNESSFTDAEGNHRVRWGASSTSHWDYGKRFKTLEDVFAFSPLELGDFTGFPVVESVQRDFRDEQKLYESYRKELPSEWSFPVLGGTVQQHWFYNTLFMWPLECFGWELFMEACLDPRFERIMDEFAEISRRVFKVFARLPINVVLSHDDIVSTRGPVCSPAWMRKHIFPRYEEYWSILKDAGKEVIFMVDGCVDAYADDIFACGARGIITEPYTDFKSIARKHKNCFLAGEGDNRILMLNAKSAIKAMVNSMLETAKITGGYAMCIGNHIPWNVPPEAVKYYLDICKELAHR